MRRQLACAIKKLKMLDRAMIGRCRFRDCDGIFTHVHLYAHYNYQSQPPVCGLGVGCDIVPIRLDDFYEEMDHPTSMFAEIARSGIKVYGGRTGDILSA